MTTPTDIVNRALELIGQQVTITGLGDGSPASDAALVLYAPARDLLLRQMDPDFSRLPAALAAQANPTLIALTGWAFEYGYPVSCLRLRQLRPVPGDYDINDPQPIRGEVMLDPLSAGGPAKVIMTNQAKAIAVYTTNSATEDQFDAGFAETLARRLANPLAMALAGRPDFARELLEESEHFAQLAELSEEL